jgi:aminoglycoside phosphotransferase (APT) family kinase protein
VRRKPIELAAVATAAVPGLTPTAVSSAPDDPADFDSALLLDSEGKRWRVRSPRHAEASARLETEFLVLRAFAPGIRAELPFLMPTVAGSVRLGSLSTFVYSHLAGSTRSVEELTAGPDALAREIGVALAAIHDLPRSLVSNADLPSYTPNEFRQRRLNELDQAATTGKIPPALLLRWEHAMEDVSLWRFNPSVVHGDLHEDNLLVEGQRVTAVTGWTDLRIGDPADDFAWLVASNEQDFVDAVLNAYTAGRRDTPDNHLLRRAALSAEFALAQYLVKGIASDDGTMVSEAEEMLDTLARDIEEHGGQPISVEPQPAAGAQARGGSPAVAPAAGPEPVVRAADAGPAGSVPSVTVVPLPVPAPVRPAVHVTPIPAEPAAGASGSSAGGTGTVVHDAADGAGQGHAGPGPADADSTRPEPAVAKEADPDDTSTAAISIVEIRKS